MTMKPKANKFRIRRSTPSSGTQARPEMPEQAPPAPERPAHQAARPRPPEQPSPAAMAGQVSSATEELAETDLNKIKQEGLTGRQLRMARRVAQKYGLAVTSDFDAVSQLRARGIDPFERSSILELVAPGGGKTPPPTAPGQAASPAQPNKVQLPQTVPTQSKALTQAAPPQPYTAERRATEIGRIQAEMQKRRRKSIAMMLTRLAMFVLLPTLMAAYYFMFIATPMYATKTEFVIQQAQSASPSASGLSGLFQGTSMATQQDSTTVQSYLASRAAMVRLDEDHAFKQHFSQEDIDPIQRLASDATNEEAFKLYQKHVKIGYDPTEGIVRMEVIAADPATSQEFSEALVGYAEEQVDQLTARLRDDQMRGAQSSYEVAEERRQEALQKLRDVQIEAATIDPTGESAALMSRITTLETQLDKLNIELQSLLSNTRPNQARVDGTRQQISLLEEQVAMLRGQMTTATGASSSLAETNARLREAEENYQFQIAIVQQALTMMETARLEANRQVRYLSIGVEPIAPDEATYPRAFENTIVALLLFAGLYLMVSLTVAILREQVAS